MRAPVEAENQLLYEYTLMPTHMRHTFSVDELQDIELSVPYAFTKGCKIMKIPARADNERRARKFGTLLFDLETDPAQAQPLDNPEVEDRMIDLLIKLMKANDAPPEQFFRLGLV